MIRLAQLSDTHVLREPGGLLYGHDTARHLTLVVEVLTGRTDVALITGDVSDDGTIDACKSARSIVDGLGCDVHVMPGNHDDPAALATVFDADAWPFAVHLSRAWTLVVVDSSVPEEAHGLVDAPALVALDELLAKTTNNAVVCMHHPPVSPCDHPYCVITNATDVVDVLTRHACVRAVLSGHHHRTFETAAPAGPARFLGAPSTYRQLVHGGEPHFRETPEPPAARMVELHDDGSVTTTIVSAPV